MKIRRCVADFHGDLLITCGSSDSFLSQLTRTLRAGILGISRINGYQTSEFLCRRNQFFEHAGLL